MIMHMKHKRRKKTVMFLNVKVFDKRLNKLFLKFNIKFFSYFEELYLSNQLRQSDAVFTKDLSKDIYFIGAYRK